MVRHSSNLLLSVKKNTCEYPNVSPSFPVSLCDLLFHHMVLLRIEASRTTITPQTQFKLPVSHKCCFRSNECNKAAHVRHAASQKQIATHHESRMATSANQLNLVNQVQTPMYSFMLLNSARLFTKSKPKFKLLHDLCSCSNLFFMSL